MVMPYRPDPAQSSTVALTRQQQVLVEVDQHLSSLLDQLYSAVIRPAEWGAVLVRMCEFFGAEGALLVVEDVAAPQPLWWTSTPAHHEEIAQTYFPRHRLNPWLLAARHRPIPSVSRTESLVPLVELRNSGFYSDCLERVGWLHSLGASLFASGSVYGYLSLLRGPAAGPFDDESLIMAGWLASHLARALRLQHELHLTNNADHGLTDLLLAYDQPIILLGEDHRVVFANSQAHAILAQADGLTVAQHQLVAHKRTDIEKLRSVLNAKPVQNTIPRRPLCCAFQRPSGLPRLICRVTRLDSGRVILQGHPVTHMLVLTDPSASPVLLDEPVVAAFDFTPAELRVARLLLRGLSMSDIASQLVVTLNTIRTHVARLFEKTGTNRQAELVTQLLAFAVPAANYPRLSEAKTPKALAIG